MEYKSNLVHISCIFHFQLLLFGKVKFYESDVTLLMNCMNRLFAEKCGNNL